MNWRSRVRVRAIAILAFAIGLAVGSHAMAQSASCEVECAKASSPYCLTVPTMLGGGSIPWAFKNLFGFTLQRVKGGTITQAQLLAFFNMSVKEDPCNRGATVFGNGSLKNTGQAACRITVSGELPGQQGSVNFGFDVPLELGSTYSNTADRIVFSFPNPNTTPAFWFEDDGLNADWGGSLRQVIYTSSITVITTDSGCIRYRY